MNSTPHLNPPDGPDAGDAGDAADDAGRWPVRPRTAGFAVAGLLAAGIGLGAGQAIRHGMSTQAPPLPPQDAATGFTGFPFDLTGSLVDRVHIRMAGPPKDGIPSIDAPRVVPIATAAAEGLDDDDRVVTVAVEGERRAYPIRLLRWHEVVNDTLGGVPVAVIHCPLCDSVSVIDRPADRAGLAPDTFGVSGQLLDSNVLVYDRSSDGLWSQVAGMAITGRQAGRRLAHRAGWSIESVADAALDPATTLVAFPDPATMPYDRNMYEDAATSEQLIFPIRRLDDRLPRKTPVIGVAVGEVAHAWDLRHVVEHQGPDGIFRAEMPGGELVLEATLGDLDPPHAGRRISVLSAPPDAVVLHTFWFAWASAHPGTLVWASGRAEPIPASPPKDAAGG